MPTTSQMLEKAADLERRAQALRVAAAEMNGDLGERKQARAEKTIEQALALRESQRPQPQRRKGEKKLTNPEAVARRLELMRDFLAEGPQKTKAVAKHLAMHDFPIGQDRVRKLLGAAPWAQTVGRAAQAQWVLAAGYDDEASGNGASRPAAKTKTKKPKVSREATAATRVKTAAFLDSLSRTDPTPTTAMGDRALSVSILLLHGYIKRKGEGYVRTGKVYTP